MESKAESSESRSETPEDSGLDELEVLAGMPVFGAVSADALEFLLNRAERRVVSAGNCYFHEGEAGDTMYVLRRGKVELMRELKDHYERIGQLGPGDCFGEMALLDLYPRSATVQATEDSSALGISHSLLFELYEQTPEPFTIIMMNLARELSRRLRSAEQRLARVRGGRNGICRPQAGEHRLPYV
jgi:CRP-like cAMP-binding protein